MGGQEAVSGEQQTVNNGQVLGKKEVVSGGMRNYGIEGRGLSVPFSAQRKGYPNKVQREKTMRIVVQRVQKAHVVVGGETVGSINEGLLVLLGVSNEDARKDADYLVEKTVNLRIFEDEMGKMNRSLIEVGGELLVVSQFTLFADCRKGRRPSFVAAADPHKAETLYEYFAEQVRACGITVATGEFQRMMEVTLTNHGPVTILLDSRKEF